jgi:hypothetical protein
LRANTAGKNRNLAARPFRLFHFFVTATKLSLGPPPRNVARLRVLRLAGVQTPERGPSALPRMSLTASMR